jgi:hypothetical protein
MVWGEKITFTAVEDIYFLTGLPFWGMPLPVELVLPADVSLVTLGQRYLSRQNYMSGFVVSIRAVDSLAHCCVAVVITEISSAHGYKNSTSSKQ